MVFTGVVAVVILVCDLEGLSLKDAWHSLTSGGMIKMPASAEITPGVAADGSLQGWTEGNKMRLLNPSLDLSKPYTIIGGILGVVVFKIAQYTTDQEFVQRQLSCKDIKKAGRSLVASQILTLPIVLVFLAIGLLLYLKYIQNPSADGSLSRMFFTDARDIFPQYIKNHIPTGARGLMIIGLLAAALSSFNSAINSMASSFVADLYLPLRKARGHEVKSDKEQMSSSRWMVCFMGALLTSFAIITCVMQQSSGLNLVDFAMGIMCFAYSGMLGVFLTAIFTKRGNQVSVMMALAVGALVILPLMFQKEIFGQTFIAWTWWCPIGGAISTLICCLGKRKEQLS